MPAKWASPRPQVPIRAMFSLLLGASAPKSRIRGRMSGAAVERATDLRKWRRFMYAVSTGSGRTSSACCLALRFKFCRWHGNPLRQNVFPYEAFPDIAHLLRQNRVMKRRAYFKGVIYFFILVSLVTAGRGATIWNGPTTNFTKANGANPSLAANQDRLTSDIWLTRGSSQGLGFAPFALVKF